MGDTRGKHIQANQFYDAEATRLPMEDYSPKHATVAEGMGASAIFDSFMPMDHLDGVSNPETDKIRDVLRQRIIGQDAAIDALVAAYDRLATRSAYDLRPIASLAFLGPTGVGKSETAKVLAEFLAEGEAESLIKIDCSNFSHGHEVAALTGSPPGYVGYGQKALLSAAEVSKAKVILFDEIEKGAPELFRLMLQIMGDGQLRLNDGTVADFCDTVVIMTSNLGASEMATEINGRKPGFGVTSRRADKSTLESVATKSFEDFFKQPEFINRINKMIVFHPLDKQGLVQVLDTKLNDVNAEYEMSYGARVNLSEGAKDYLANMAMERPDLGARPLIRALEDHIQTPFGRYLGSGHIPESTLVAVFHKDEVPAGYIEDDRTLIFSQTYDSSIKKWVKPSPSREGVAIGATKYDAFTFQQPTDGHNKPAKDPENE